MSTLLPPLEGEGGPEGRVGRNRFGWLVVRIRNGGGSTPPVGSADTLPIQGRDRCRYRLKPSTSCMS